MTYNPNYVPVGRNSRDNPYYKTENHVAIPRNWSNKREFTAGQAIVNELFAGGVAGMACTELDPANGRLFQDAAGTIPADTAGDPIGLVIDVSGNGMDAIQDVNDDKRPTLARHPASGLRNLLTWTEDLSNAVWVKTGTPLTVVVDNALSYFGGMTADTVSGSASFQALQNTSVVVSAGTYTNTYWVANATQDQVTLRAASGANDVRKIFTLSTGAITDGGGNGIGYVDGIVVDLDNGFYSVSMTFTVDGTSLTTNFYPDDLAQARSHSLEMSGAQLETGSAATPYQKVTTQYDVTEAGQWDLWYADFDGVDDYLYVPSLDMSASDELSVFVGVHKTNDAAQTVLLETSTSAGSFDGTFRVRAPTAAAADNYRVSSKGTALAGVTASGFPSPTTNVVSLISKITTDSLVVRVDGTDSAGSGNDQGTGNYGNHPLFICSRAGTALFFDGRLYGWIVRNKLTTGTPLKNTESYLATLSGIA